MSSEAFFMSDDLDGLRQGKRKRTGSDNRPAKKRKMDLDDLEESSEEIESSEDEDEDLAAEEMAETAAEKRLRIAQQYLASARVTEQEKAEDRELDDTQLARKLDEEAKESAGRLIRPLATKMEGALGEDGMGSVARVMRGHHLAPTCCAITEDGVTAFSGAKDCSIIHWDVETGKKVVTRGGRKYPSSKTSTGQVLAVAVNDAGTLLASGGRDNMVRVWDTRTRSQVAVFKGHKDAVTCLAIRKKTNQLFSGSKDRTIRIFSLDQLVYTESLYGHQDEVWGIDSMAQERAVSCGGDESCRLWKVAEEKQMLYKGHNASIDCLSMFNEEHWLTGSQDGSVALWNIGKKKPVFTQAQAHGPSNPWVSSVSALNYSNVAASGSHTGLINLWKLKSHKLQRLGAVPVVGFVNGIAFSKSGKVMVAAVGQEHRLGRWWRKSEARNSLQVVSFDLQ